MLKRINKVRKSIMIGLTKNIGVSRINTKKNTHASLKRILINRPNHRLGNLLLVTPLVQEIKATFPDCKVDLFVKGGLAPILFENYDNVDRIIKLPKKPFKELVKYLKVWVKIKKHRYDMVINLDKDSSSGRLSTQFARATNKIFGENIEELENLYKDYRHMGKRPVYLFRHFIRLLGYKSSDLSVPPLDIKLSNEELFDGKKRLEELVSQDKKTISIFTYATGSKCYEECWWDAYYGKLLEAFPDYNIVEILPVENISKIGFKAPSFYSKDVREIAAVIANTAVFIGADSGIMHLAASSQAPVVGLFSVTNPEKYEPYGNGSIAVDTNKVDLDENILLVKKILESRQPESLQYA
ncbi:MAG: ADP-heptose--LPS heptosyltransferase [Flavobacterium psychrophilum]|nr:MAG: ADP-heptose--LPS heptosyltransferase [Flavobacterium psychrophilum]